MLELNEAECGELERRAMDRYKSLKSDPTQSTALSEAIALVSTRATIITIQEYESLKQPDLSTIAQKGAKTQALCESKNLSIWEKAVSANPK